MSSEYVSDEQAVLTNTGDVSDEFRQLARDAGWGEDVVGFVLSGNNQKPQRPGVNVSLNQMEKNLVRERGDLGWIHGHLRKRPKSLRG